MSASEQPVYSHEFENGTSLEYKEILLATQVHVWTFERSLRHPLPYALQRYKKGYITQKHFSITPPSNPPFPLLSDIDGKESLIAERLRSLHHSSSPPQQTLISQFSCRSANSSLFLSFRLFVSCHLSASRLNFPCRPLMPNRTSLFCILWRSSRLFIPIPSL